MAVDIFSKEDFENALPVNNKTNQKMCESIGVDSGEYAYIMNIKPNVKIMIRSSVQRNGYSADTGEDSIRAWLVNDDNKPLGSKIQSYVTRVPGWSDRLVKMLRELYSRGTKIQPCPVCGNMMGVYKVKKDGANKGRLFTKCRDHDNTFNWI